MKVHNSDQKTQIHSTMTQKWCLYYDCRHTSTFVWYGPNKFQHFVCKVTVWQACMWWYNQPYWYYGKRHQPALPCHPVPPCSIASPPPSFLFLQRISLCNLLSTSSSATTKNGRRRGKNLERKKMCATKRPLWYISFVLGSKMLNKYTIRCVHSAQAHTKVCWPCPKMFNFLRCPFYVFFPFWSRVTHWQRALNAKS